MKERIPRSRRGAVAVAAVLFLAALAPVPASADRVRILQHGVEPGLISPANGDGIQDEAVLSVRMAVRNVAGLEAGRHRAPGSDPKRYFVLLDWRMVDGTGAVVATIASETEIPSFAAQVAVPGMKGRGSVPWIAVDAEAVWNGSGAAGEALPDGVYRYSAVAAVFRENLLGNGKAKRLLIGESDPVAGTVTVDNTPPVIRILDLPQCTASGVVPRIVVEDDHPGPVRIYLDGESYEDGSPITAEGDHHLVVEAEDLAGNGARAEAEFIIDRTAPVIRVTGASDGETVAPETALTIAIEEDNLVLAVILLDGEPYESGTPVSEPGEHLLSVEAEDCAGNRSESEVSFTVAGGESRSTALFTNFDDPALLRSGAVEAFGARDAAGLPAALRTIRRTDDGTVVRFDEEGRLRRILSGTGTRLEFERVATGELFVTWVEEGASVRSSATFEVDGTPEPVVSASTLGIALRQRGQARPFRSILSVNPDPAEPEPAPAPAVEVCSGTVRLSACGTAVDGADLFLHVTPVDPAVEPYTVPLEPGGGGLYRYSLPCDAGPLPGVPEQCSAVERVAAAPCDSLAAVGTIGTDAICGMLADNLSYISPSYDDAARAGVAERCEAMIASAMESCAVVREGCGNDGEPVEIDRRAAGDLELAVEGGSDVLGRFTIAGAADGAGPFPDLVYPDDEGAKILRFEAEWLGRRHYEVAGEVVCAPAGSSMRYVSWVCDIDRATPYCYPYDVRQPVYGRGSIDSVFDGSYNWDLVWVTFEVTGVPARKVALRY